MTWKNLLDIIAEEAGPALAARIAERARHELAGVRITVSVRPVLSAEQVVSVAPGRPRDAARALGVHPATVYRILRRRPLVR